MACPEEKRLNFPAETDPVGSSSMGTTAITVRPMITSIFILLPLSDLAQAQAPRTDIPRAPVARAPSVPLPRATHSVPRTSSDTPRMPLSKSPVSAPPVPSAPERLRPTCRASLFRQERHSHGWKRLPQAITRSYLRQSCALAAV